MSEYLHAWNDIEKLRKAHTVVQYFGLGFVQVKLSPTERIHYYHPNLSASIPEESAHNHRYGFVSNILKGQLIQTMFRESNGDEFQKTQETCMVNEETTLEEIALTGLVKTSEYCLSAGSKYFIDDEQIHKVRAEGKTVTHIHRPQKALKELADVYTPVSKDLLCPFASTLSAEELWDIIEDTVRD